MQIPVQSRCASFWLASCSLLSCPFHGTNQKSLSKTTIDNLFKAREAMSVRMKIMSVELYNPNSCTSGRNGSQEPTIVAPQGSFFLEKLGGAR